MLLFVSRRHRVPTDGAVFSGLTHFAWLLCPYEQRMLIHGAELEPSMSLANFRILLAERTGVDPSAQEIVLEFPSWTIHTGARLKGDQVARKRRMIKIHLYLFLSFVVRSGKAVVQPLLLLVWC